MFFNMFNVIIADADISKSKVSPYTEVFVQHAGEIWKIWSKLLKLWGVFFVNQFWHTVDSVPKTTLVRQV